MTTYTKNSIKLTLGAVILIFGMGVAWKELRGDVQSRLPETRFLAESARTDGTFKAFLRSDMETQRLLREINDRLKEICIGVRSGCR